MQCGNTEEKNTLLLELVKFYLFIFKNISIYRCSQSNFLVTDFRVEPPPPSQVFKYLVVLKLARLQQVGGDTWECDLFSPLVPTASLQVMGKYLLPLGIINLESSPDSSLL